MSTACLAGCNVDPMRRQLCAFHANEQEVAEEYRLALTVEDYTNSPSRPRAAQHYGMDDMTGKKNFWRLRLARRLCRWGIHDLGGAVVSRDVCPTCGYSRHERDRDPEPPPPTILFGSPDE